jgi:D-alanyl-D-alanine carboxypeptidase/D-alanyl-D-alanine-endopeptidase (penicillin-binding protein 4)
MVKESDNTLAEVLARHVSVAVGLGGQAQTVNQALTGILAGRGLPLEGVTLRDGSGLSSLNRVKPQYVAALLLEMYHSGGNLALVRQSLPVAGVDGSLKDRFAGPNAGLVGKVEAKTGTIKGVRALAGYVNASDDTELIFAFFATGDVGEASRVAIETLVTGIYTCGDNLAHF